MRPAGPGAAGAARRAGAARQPDQGAAVLARDRRLEPLRRDRRRRLPELRTGDGRSCRRIFWRRSSASWRGWNCCSTRSRRSSAHAMRCWRRRRRPRSRRGRRGKPPRRSSNRRPQRRPKRLMRHRRRLMRDRNARGAAGGAAHSAAGGSRRANAHAGGAAAGSEGNRGGGRRPPVDGRVLAKLLQPPANRLLRRPRGDAVAQRFDRARTGRVANRQCALRTMMVQLALAVAAASAAIGAVAVVCRAGGECEAAPQDHDRGAGAQAARRLVEICGAGRRPGGRDREAGLRRRPRLSAPSPVGLLPQAQRRR